MLSSYQSLSTDANGNQKQQEQNAANMIDQILFITQVICFHALYAPNVSC